MNISGTRVIMPESLIFRLREPAGVQYRKEQLLKQGRIKDGITRKVLISL
jgi:hypothetical protein